MPPFLDQSSRAGLCGAHHPPCPRRELQSWVSLDKEMVVIGLSAKHQLPVRTSGNLVGAMELLRHSGQCYIYREGGWAN
jgi:hypothetical protein